MTAPETDKAPPRQFAIVQLFGHARIAGAVSEQTFGGASFVRVDVPEVTYTEVDYDTPAPNGGERQQVRRTIPGHTRSLGPSSIYSIDWCDEAAAVAAAHSIRHQPVNPYSVRKALAALPQSQHLLAGPREDDIPY